MQGIVSLLEKSVKTKETRLLMGRLMRQTAQLRGHMTAADLESFITIYLPADSKSGAYLAGFIKQVCVSCRQALGRRLGGRCWHHHPLPIFQHGCSWNRGPTMSGVSL